MVLWGVSWIFCWIQWKSPLIISWNRKTSREHKKDVTLIVNPLSLPLIFHGFSCLLGCFPAQECWLEAFVEVETVTGTRASVTFVLRPVSPLYPLIHVFLTFSGVTSLCARVFVGAIMQHSKITNMAFTFTYCFNLFVSHLIGQSQGITDVRPHHKSQNKTNPDKHTISASQQRAGTDIISNT